jgi:choline dehydrogenase
MQTSLDEYDYIVVGAGPAGCLLANRLSADPQHRVLLLEAGGRDNYVDSHPGRLPVLHRQPAHRLVLQDRSPTRPARPRLSYPRGKVLGGCSSINGMIYMRGQAATTTAGRPKATGLGWKDVLPLFKQSENHFAGAANFTAPANGGSSNSAVVADSRCLPQAAEQSGIASIDDFNQGDNEGCGYFQVNQKAGVRWNAAKAFLKPIRQRPNLTVLTGVEVDRVLLENGRACRSRASRPGKASRRARKSSSAPVPSARRASCSARESARAVAGTLGIGVRNCRASAATCRTTCNCA